MTRPKKPDCYECAHRRQIPGEYNSRCVAPRGIAEGARNAELSGWWTWPRNFDPLWLVNCSGYTPIPTPKEEEPIAGHTTAQAWDCARGKTCQVCDHSGAEAPSDYERDRR